VYVVPSYWWDASYLEEPVARTQSDVAGGSAVPSDEPLTGTLRLELQSERDVQVYVDGYFVGTLEDLRDELVLEPGPHSIDVRASDYETLAFDVRIAAGRSITYRGVLTPTTPRPEPLVTPPPPSTFYFIPGCYLGNVHPQEVQLPPGCDLSRMITRTP
jgi:hypothetical protein